MKHNRDAPDGFKNLRQEAERLLRAETISVDRMSETDIAALLHELRVHQIELEMQNEELRRAQVELEESRSKYSDLFDFAPIGYLVFDPNGVTVEANLAAATMLKVERRDLTGAPFIVHVRQSSRDTWRSHYQAVFKTGEPQECELELQRTDEALLVVRLRSRPVTDADGKVVQCRTAMTNITALARAERRLKESERRFRTLTENALDIIARIDRQMHVVYVNKAVESILDIPPEEFVGHTFEELGVPDEISEKWTAAIENVFRTGQSGRTEFDCPTPQGLRYYSAVVVPEFEEDRTVNTVIVTVRDMTDRVRTEERYSTIVRNSQEGFAIIDRQGRYLEANEAFCRLLDHGREELLTMSVADVLEPEQQQEVMQHMDKAAREGYDHCHVWHRRKDGSRTDCDVSIQKLNGDRFFVFARDVTEQSRAQQQIAFQARILKDISDAVIAFDNEWRVTYWSNAAEQLYGIPAAEALGKKRSDLYKWRWLEPHDEKTLLDALEQTGSWQGHKLHITKSGAELRVRVIIGALNDDAGRRIGLLAVIHDETQEKKAEEERMETLRRLELVAQATNDGIWDWDLATDTLWHNEAYLTAFGYDAEEADVSTRWWREHIHPQDRDEVLATLDEALRSGQDRWSARYRFQRKNGSYAWVVARGYVLRDEQARAVRVVGSMLDLTERLELLDQLEDERRKLETVLETALGGIVVVDEQARITYANPTAQEILGRPVPLGEEFHALSRLEICYTDGRPYDPRDLPLTRSALDGEKHTEVELVIQRPNGENRHILANTNPLQDREGNLDGAVGIFQDITDLKRAEQGLREAHDKLEERVRRRTIELDGIVATLHEEVAEKMEAQNQLMQQNEVLQKIVDNIPVMLCFYDSRGHVILINEAMSRILGYSLPDFEERQMAELLYPDPQECRAAWEHLTAAGPGWRDFIPQSKDGDKVVSSWASVRLSENSYVGIGIDIRQRHEFEDRLRESEERYRTLVELSPDAIGVVRDGIIRFVNSTAIKLLGASTADQILGRPVLEFLHPDQRKRTQRQFAALRRRHKPLPATEEKLLRLDGAQIDVEVTAILITFEGELAHQVVVRDITRRKQVENRLRENARQLQQQAELLDLAHDSIVVHDMEGRIAFWNRGAEQTYGWTPDEALGKISHELLQTQFPLNLIEITAKLLSQGRWNGELRHTTRSGDAIIVSSRWALQRDEDGRPTGILVIDRDITQQKQAEIATLQARQFAESVINTVQESLLVLDQDLKVISANQTFYRVFRIVPEDTVGRFVYDIGNRQWDIPELRRLLEDILPQNTCFEGFEVEHDFASIGHRTMLLNARRIQPQAEEAERILLAIEDITVRKEQEHKIQEHQRQLASLTEELLLTEERERHRIAVVLHDSIGQSLAFSKRELGVVQKSTPENVREAIEYVKKQIDDAIRQTRNLTFELSPSTLHTFGLEAAVEELAEQFAQREGFQYHFEATEDNKPLTEQIKTLLYRAARELLMNAARHAEAPDVFIRIDRVDKKIRMVIEDNGKGFDVSRLDEVVGRHEGFGLFSIRERLTYIGGTFHIESVPGKGTKVTLTAPLYLTNQEGSAEP